MSEISAIHRARRADGGNDTHELARDLAEAVGQLRRSIRRQVRRGFPHVPLGGNERELVLLLRDRSDLRVGDAATALGLADNTVSTLVGRLSELGLVRRGTDPRDARVARLSLTPAARRRVADWRDRSAQLIGAAIDDLPASDRRALEDAVPALQALRSRLEEEAL